MINQLLPTPTIEVIKSKDIPMIKQTAGKTRITIIHKDTEETVGWYGTNTPSKTIEDAIRTVFQLPSNTRLLLKDQDGDVVAIAANLPMGGSFTLHTLASQSSEESTHHSISIKSSFGSTNSLDEANIEPSGSLNSSSSSPDLKSMDNDGMESLKRDHQQIINGEIDDDDEDDPRKKRKRRKATEIDRTFKCSMSNCQKVYGSENALKMHMKLKHPEYPYLLQNPNQKSSPIIVNNKVMNFNQPNQNSFQQPSLPQQSQSQQSQQNNNSNSNNNNSRISTSLLFPSQRATMSNNNGYHKLTLPDMDPNEILLLSKQFSQQQQHIPQQFNQIMNKNSDNKSNERSPDTNSPNMFGQNNKQLYQYSLQELLPMVRKSMEQINGNREQINSNNIQTNKVINSIQQQLLRQQQSSQRYRQQSSDEDDDDISNDDEEDHHDNKQCNNSNHSNNNSNILPPLSSLNSNEKGNLSFLVSSPSTKVNFNNNSSSNTENHHESVANLLVGLQHF